MSVLVAIDVDQAPHRPITVGYDLATAFDEMLIVMYVMSEKEYNKRQESRDELPEEFSQKGFTLDDAINSAARQVGDIVDEVLGSYDHARVEPRGRVGSPADEILAAADEINPRFLVVGGRKQSSARQAIFGSVSQAIVRNAEQPVVTITESTMSSGKVRNSVSRTIDGVEALVTTESDEIFIDVPAADPRYIRVEEGDTIREGDVRSKREEELESPSLRKWTVETIGSETVIGTDQATGEQSEWDRELLEQRLATGGFSAVLTDFERVNVTGEPSTTDLEESRSDEVIITVAVHGNDGRKFIQKYRLIDEEEGEQRHLELEKEDASVEKFETDLQEQFNRAVEHALRNEGYSV